MDFEKEVKKIQYLIDNYDRFSDMDQQKIDKTLLGLFCFVKNSEDKLETLSDEQIELITTIKKQLSSDQKSFISNLFLKKVLNIEITEPYITLSDLKSIYADGTYLALEELLEIKKAAFEVADSDLLNYVEYLLRKKLYYNTLEEAEQALDHYERSHSEETTA